MRELRDLNMGGRFKGGRFDLLYSEVPYVVKWAR